MLAGKPGQGCKQGTPGKDASRVARQGCKQGSPDKNASRVAQARMQAG